MQIFGPGPRVLQNSQPGGLAETANKIAAAAALQKGTATVGQENGRSHVYPELHSDTR